MVSSLTLVPLTGAVLSFALALLTLLAPLSTTRKRVFFGLMSLCTGLWLLTVVALDSLAAWFAIGTSGFESAAVLWFVIESFASTGVAFYWFLFAMEQAGYKRWTTGWALWAQHGLALMVSLSFATSPVQALVYSDWTAGELAHTMGPLGPVANLFVYAWAIAALAVFGWTALRDPAPRTRRIALLVAVLGLGVLLGAIVSTLRVPLGLDLRMDPGIMLMPILNLAVAYYVFRVGVDDIVPVSAGVAFRYLSDGVIVTDSSGRVVTSNDVAAMVFGEAADRAPLVKLLSQAGLDPIEYESWDRSRGPLEFEASAAGRPYWVRVAALPGEHALAGGTLVLATDITGLRDAEGEVRRVNRDLVEAQAARERFLRNVGRELRSPLETIIGMSGVLLDELPGAINEEQRSQISLIRDSGDRLLQVFDRIIHLAAARAEEMDVVHEEVDICVLASDVVRSLRPMATRKSLELTFKSSCDDCRILTDAQHVRSILDNLGSNAIEYTSEGGITMTVVRTEGWVEIDVADTGRGIPRTLHERVFEEFGHAENDDPAAPEGGAHIGLALSRQLARKLGGDISLESSPGIGSTFRLAIPVIEP